MCNQTGNDFLNEYPFDKKLTSMSKEEFWHTIRYKSILDGVMLGNSLTLGVLQLKFASTPNEEFLPLKLLLRVCNMTKDQQIRIIKKWCDDNPDKTHFDFVEIIFTTFLSLPPTSAEDCIK
tara:strand:- start:3616 stop:3978 length:363 start_codon:yes stop_codon:yes gene_type:complete